MSKREAETGASLMVMQSWMEARWGLLNRPTWRGGSALMRMDDRRAETLPLPLVPATWRVGRVYGQR